MKYNTEHGITPTQIKKAVNASLLPNGEPSTLSTQSSTLNAQSSMPNAFAADPIVQRMTRPQLEKSIEETTRLMKEAAKRLDFLQAAQYRDEIVRLQKELELK